MSGCACRSAGGYTERVTPSKFYFRKGSCCYVIEKAEKQAGYFTAPCYGDNQCTYCPFRVADCNCCFEHYVYEQQRQQPSGVP